MNERLLRLAGMHLDLEAILEYNALSTEDALESLLDNGVLDPDDLIGQLIEEGIIDEDEFEEEGYDVT